MSGSKIFLCLLILSVLLILPTSADRVLLECKRFDINVIVKLKINVYGCTSGNTCFYTDIVTEENSEIQFWEQGTNGRQCIVFLNSTLHHIPAKIFDRYTGFLGILAANSSIKETVKLSDQFTLTFLDLSQNQLTDYSRTIYSKNVDLSYNQITTIEDSAFQMGYNDYLRLNVSHNLLNNLSLRWLKLSSYPSSSSYLDFSHNNISTISGTIDYDYGFPINLSHNQLTNLPASILIKTSSQSKLDVSHNNIEKVDVFSQCSIKMIDFSFNSLSAIPNNLINNCKNLLEIDFSSNKIRNLHEMTSSSLTELNLMNNKIESFSFNYITGLSNLQNLHLSHNNITNLSADPHFPVSLTRLDLSYNNITAVPLQFLESITASVLDMSHSGIEEFTGVKVSKLSLKIGSFDLTRNNITQVPLQFFDYLTIDYLYMSHSGIKGFTGERDLTSYSTVKNLDLSNNKITSMPIQLLSNLHATLVDMSFNKILHLIGYKDHQQDNFNIQKLDLSNNKIKTLPMEFIGKISPNYLQLESNEISGFVDPWSSKEIEVLNLANNKIKTIPFESFADFQVKNLILEGNKVVVDLGMFPKNMVTLDLRNNGLSKVDLNNFIFYKHLTTLYFDGNNLKSNFLTDRITMSKIKMIGISGNVFTCSQLIKLHEVAIRYQISLVANGYLAKNTTNINGIGCVRVNGTTTNV